MQVRDFVVISNDTISNKLTQKIIEKTYPEAGVKTCSEPEEAFDYFAKRQTEDAITVVLLDMRMRTIDGLEFIDKCTERLNEKITKGLRFYILSPTVNKEDMHRAQSNIHVEYYLIKPLTKESIILIVRILNKRLGVITE